MKLGVKLLLTLFIVAFFAGCTAQIENGSNQNSTSNKEVVEFDEQTCIDAGGQWVVTDHMDEKTGEFTAYYDCYFEQEASASNSETENQISDDLQEIDDVLSELDDFEGMESGVDVSLE